MRCFQEWIYREANEASTSDPVIGTGPFQGPGWGLGGPGNVFTWPYVFEKFTNVRYFDRNRLSIKEVCLVVN